MSNLVVLHEYSPKWSHYFETEKNSIMQSIGEQILAIEHIGSTSINGMTAKPIIDLMLGVKNLKEVSELVEPLIMLKYEYKKENPIPNRAFFKKETSNTYHLHIYTYQSTEWQDNILFRDYLRNNTMKKQAYEQLKKSLAVKFVNDRPSYTKAKSPFIKQMINEARAIVSNRQPDE